MPATSQRPDETDANGQDKPEPAPVTELPGDSVCWLRLVCTECGAMAEAEPPTNCPQCGALLEAGR